VDGQAVFAGGRKFLDNGVDVTKEVIARLKDDDVSAVPSAVKSDKDEARAPKPQSTK
jgi:hypothetical protein